MPALIQARLVHRKVNGKDVQVLTSMTDPLRFPTADIVDLYSHHWEIELGYREMKHWEIELGYREMKQSLLGHRLTLRSRTSAMVY